MELIYRGTAYKRHPSKASDRPFQQDCEHKSADELSYRGVPYRPNAKPTEALVEPVFRKLVYRGVTYYNLLFLLSN